MEDQNQNSEQEEYDEEESPCNECAMNNYPDFALEPDGESLKQGVVEASYLLGFAGSINALGLSEASLMQIILSKIDFGHNKELMRMQNASDERKAEIWAKSKLNVIDNGMDD